MLNKILKKVFGKDASWHWQNLNERPGDRICEATGPAWVRGRAWFNLGKHFSINPNWDFWNDMWKLGLKIDQGESEITFAFGIPPISLWLSFGVPFKVTKWLAGKEYERDTSIAFHNGSVWINIWHDDNSWSSGKTFWEQRHWSFNFVDAILGRPKHTERTIETHEVMIPMPEGNYPATVKMFESTWKRPRYPMSKRVLRADVKIKDGKCIPHPGKGTMSYNCGMDGLYGTCCPARNVEDAIGSMVISSLRSRRRYGGPNWEPEEKDIPKIVEKR
jgi:hypothetical protein